MDDVKRFLENAGMDEENAKEIINYGTMGKLAMGMVSILWVCYSCTIVQVFLLYLILINIITMQFSDEFREMVEMVSQKVSAPIDQVKEVFKRNRRVVKNRKSAKGSRVMRSDKTSHMKKTADFLLRKLDYKTKLVREIKVSIYSS